VLRPPPRDQREASVTVSSAGPLSRVSTSIAEIQARKQQLRRALRRRRRALTPRQQRAAARALYRRVVMSKLFRFSRRLTFTLARDGEISTELLMREAARRGKRCYLPVMHNIGSIYGRTRLTFREWQAGARLRKGRFGIPEPKLGRLGATYSLGAVFMPLVGFDARCNRLGMGRAYYDNTFAFLRRSQRPRPALVGLAHDCQRVDPLAPAPWDVPLRAIVTDKAWYHPHPTLLAETPP
jgi:5-formyltetrahydrofolate cyclo-ligase